MAQLLIQTAMKSLLLGLLVSSVVAANQCAPKKSNPKNEQCAKDLMKDGIGSLPSDLQSQLMEPLVQSLAKKLTKDIMEDMNKCQPEKPQQCQGTADVGPIAKPTSEEGNKMFDDAKKDIEKNANQLAKDVENKLGDIEKDIEDQVTGNLKDLLGETGNLANMFGNMTENLGGDVPNLLGNIKNSVSDALGGLKKKMGGVLNSTLGDAAKKQFEGLKKKVNEMPKAGLDYLTKQLKDKAGDLADKTLGPLKGEMKGLVDGFIGALVPDLNITGFNFTVEGISPKLNWLKNKLKSVADNYGDQFGFGATAVTGGVIGGFLSQIPDEFKEKEILSLHDVVFLPVHLLDAFNQTIDEAPVKEDAFVNGDMIKVDGSGGKFEDGYGEKFNVSSVDVEVSE